MNLEVVTLKGKKVALGPDDRIFRKEKVERLIASQAAKVASATTKKVDVDKDIALAGISDVGKSILETISEKLDREIARGNAIGTSLSAIVDQLDPSQGVGVG